MLEIAKGAVRLHVVPEAGAAGGDRVRQRLLDRGYEPDGPLARYRMGRATRADRSGKQRLADVDVTEPRDHGLIEQGGFDRRVPPGQRRSQTYRVEIAVQRFWSKPEEPRMLLFVVAFDHVDGPEPARIDEADPPARCGFDDEVLVCLRDAKDVRDARRRHSSRHSEMQQDRYPPIQPHQNVFGPPRELDDMGAGHHLP